MNYTTEEAAIFHDMENLPVHIVAAKHGKDRKELKAIYAKLSPFFPRKRLRGRNRDLKKTELKEFMREFNEANGTGWIPLI